MTEETNIKALLIHTRKGAQRALIDKWDRFVFGRVTQLEKTFVPARDSEPDVDDDGTDVSIQSQMEQIMDHLGNPAAVSLRVVKKVAEELRLIETMDDLHKANNKVQEAVFASVGFRRMDNPAVARRSWKTNGKHDLVYVREGAELEDILPCLLEYRVGISRAMLQRMDLSYDDVERWYKLSRS